MLETVTLQRAEIIGKSRLAKKLLEDFPVSPFAVRPPRFTEPAAQIRDDDPVVEQRIVDVEQKDDVGGRNIH